MDPPEAMIHGASKPPCQILVGSEPWSTGHKNGGYISVRPVNFPNALCGSDVGKDRGVPMPSGEHGHHRMAQLAKLARGPVHIPGSGSKRGNWSDPALAGPSARRVHEKADATSSLRPSKAWIALVPLGLSSIVTARFSALK